MHITKAMQLVASSKMKRATAAMERSRAYAAAMRRAFSRLGKEGDAIYFGGTDGAPTCLIVIAGDRGLAGGYNNNIFKLAAQNGAADAVILPIGARAVDHFTRHGHRVIHPCPSVEDFSLSAASEIAKELHGMYRRGEIGRICILSTAYRSMLSQEAVVEVVLPLSLDSGEDRNDFTLYEPSAGAVLSALIPEYLAGLFFGAATESFNAELAARRNAMDAATGNAEEMIDRLSLAYNRARQGAITQEITEIVGGSVQED
jgi:F-type H+-transporting ATPase subunit gamma